MRRCPTRSSKLSRTNKLVRLLLDTSIVLWLATDSPRLSNAARREIQNANIVFVSAVSLWEMAIKAGLGKLEVDLARLSSRMAEAGIRELTVTWRHAMALRTLTDHPRDPFDRMLIAQAISEPLRLVTSDARLRAYSDLVVVV